MAGLDQPSPQHGAATDGPENKPSHDVGKGVPIKLPHHPGPTPGAGDGHVWTSFDPDQGAPRRLVLAFRYKKLTVR